MATIVILFVVVGTVVGSERYAAASVCCRRAPLAALLLYAAAIAYIVAPRRRRSTAAARPPNFWRQESGFASWRKRRFSAGITMLYSTTIYVYIYATRTQIYSPTRVCTPLVSQSGATYNIILATTTSKFERGGYAGVVYFFLGGGRGRRGAPCGVSSGGAIIHASLVGPAFARWRLFGRRAPLPPLTRLAFH